MTFSKYDVECRKVTTIIHGDYDETLYFNHPMMNVDVVKERVEEAVSEGWRRERLRGVTKPSIRKTRLGSVLKE